MADVLTGVYLSLGVISFLGSLVARMIRSRVGRPARWLPAGLGCAGAGLLAAAVGLDEHLLWVVAALAPATALIGLILLITSGLPQQSGAAGQGSGGCLGDRRSDCRQRD